MNIHVAFYYSDMLAVGHVELMWSAAFVCASAGRQQKPPTRHTHFGGN